MALLFRAIAQQSARHGRRAAVRLCVPAVRALSSAAHSTAEPFAQSSSSGDAHNGGYSDPKPAIMEAALKHVSREGWSQEALSAGAQDLGYPSVAQGMFTNGAAELVHFAATRATEHMSSVLEQADLAAMHVHERVRLGVKARLEYLAPFMSNGSWAQAMAIGALPQNALQTARQLAVASDEIWWHAGDRSTDTTWYSRRALLMAVEMATEVFMLTDRSPGFGDTWEYLDRALADVTHFGRTAGEGLAVAQAVGGGVASIAGAGFDLVRPLLGPFASVGLQLLGGVVDGATKVGGAVVSGAAGAAGLIPPAFQSAAAASSTSGSMRQPESAADLVGGAASTPSSSSSGPFAFPLPLPPLPNIPLPNLPFPSLPSDMSPLRMAPAPIVDALASAAGTLMRAFPLPPLPINPLAGSSPTPGGGRGSSYDFNAMNGIASSSSGAGGDVTASAAAAGGMVYTPPSPFPGSNLNEETPPFAPVTPATSGMGTGVLAEDAGGATDASTAAVPPPTTIAPTTPPTA